MFASINRPGWRVSAVEHGAYMRILSSLALTGSILATSGCAGSAAPNLQSGHYFMAGDKDCKQGKNVSETRIMCFDKKMRFTGYRDEMTQLDWELYLAAKSENRLASAQFQQSMQNLINNPLNFGQQALQQSQQFPAPQNQSWSPQVNSKGVTYLQSGNTFVGSNGVVYNYVGETLMGSDGTKCRAVGPQILCN